MFLTHFTDEINRVNIIDSDILQFVVIVHKLSVTICLQRIDFIYMQAMPHNRFRWIMDNGRPHEVVFQLADIFLLIDRYTSYSPIGLWL